MKRILVFALAVLLVPSMAQAQTLDFEDAQLGFLPNGYGGFNWSNFVAYNTADLFNGGYDTGAVSGDQAIYNAFGNSASVLGVGTSNPFSLSSAWVTAAWNEGMQLQVRGFLNGTVQYTQAFDVFYDQAVQLAFNTALVDQVEFSAVGGTDASQTDSGSGTQMAFDDMAFNVVEVPEPGLIILLSSGLLGLGIARRRNDVA